MAQSILHHLDYVSSINLAVGPPLWLAEAQGKIPPQFHNFLSIKESLERTDESRGHRAGENNKSHDFFLPVISFALFFS